MDTKRIVVVWRYFIIFLQLFCTELNVDASDADVLDGEPFPLVQKSSDVRFADVLCRISNKQIAQDYVELCQARALWERPQLLMCKQINSLDSDIHQIYEQRILIDKQLIGLHDKLSKTEHLKNDIVMQTERLVKEKEAIKGCIKRYDKVFNDVDFAECEDELRGIMMSSDSKKLEQCDARIAIMHGRAMELVKKMAPLVFELKSLGEEREQLNSSSEDLHKKRAKLTQLQAICFDGQTKALFDQFDEQIELSIATAYAYPTGIFDRLVKITTDARECCAWCFALLKVFQDVKPSYQQIVGHIQNKESYCQRQIKCDLCNYFSIKKERLFSKIAKRCLQQLKHDKLCLICLNCNNSLMKKDILLREGAFINHLEKIIAEYVAFRLDYLEFFQKQPVSIPITSRQYPLITDLLGRYYAVMQHLKHLLDAKNDIQYLKRGIKHVGHTDDAFEGFLTKKELSERAAYLLCLSQLKIDKVLQDVSESSCQSSSSSSSSSHSYNPMQSLEFNS